jgi:hypothetical protein
MRRFIVVLGALLASEPFRATLVSRCVTVRS